MWSSLSPESESAGRQCGVGELVLSILITLHYTDGSILIVPAHVWQSHFAQTLAVIAASGASGGHAKETLLMGIITMSISAIKNS